MNAIQILMTQLQNQLKSQNPQMFQQLEQLKRNNNNPKEILKDITEKYSPQQREQFIKYIKSYGISDDQINEYGINTK